MRAAFAFFVEAYKFWTEGFNDFIFQILQKHVRDWHLYMYLSG